MATMVFGEKPAAQIPVTDFEKLRLRDNRYRGFKVPRVLPVKTLQDQRSKIDFHSEQLAKIRFVQETLATDGNSFAKEHSFQVLEASERDLQDLIRYECYIAIIDSLLQVSSSQRAVLNQLRDIGDRIQVSRHQPEIEKTTLGELQQLQSKLQELQKLGYYLETIKKMSTIVSDLIEAVKKVKKLEEEGENLTFCELKSLRDELQILKNRKCFVKSVSDCLKRISDIAAKKIKIQYLKVFIFWKEFIAKGSDKIKALVDHYLLCLKSFESIRKKSKDFREEQRCVGLFKRGIKQSLIETSTLFFSEELNFCFLQDEKDQIRIELEDLPDHLQELANVKKECLRRIDSFSPQETKSSEQEEKRD